VAVDPNALCSLAALKAHLGITDATDDGILEASIDRASALIESFLGRAIKTRTRTEWLPAGTPDTVRLTNYPIVSVEGVYTGAQTAMTVSLDGSTYLAATASLTTLPPLGWGTSAAAAIVLSATNSLGTTTTTTLSLDTYDDVSALVAQIDATAGFNASLVTQAPSWRLRPIAGVDAKVAPVNFYAATTPIEYAVHADRGLLSLGFHVPSWSGVSTDFRSSPIVVRYTTGYSVVPPDIEYAAIEAAKSIYQSRKASTSIASESLGGYSYSLRGEGTSGAMRVLLTDLLSAYREIR
jgi:hypothetical protein